MAIFGQGLGGIGNVLSVLLPFLFVLTIVVFIHELGHFLVARWCGVKIKAFSIGFGREIFGFYDRYGTRWRFAWIPLGGYVKFLDDENSASVPSKAALDKMTPAEREGAFQSQSLAGRSAIVVAGPVANFLLAIVIFAGIAMWYGKQETAPRVDEVVPNSAAAAAGFKPGDLVVSIDGSAIENFSDMQRQQRARRPCQGLQRLWAQHLWQRLHLPGRPLAPGRFEGDARPARDLRPIRQQAARRRDRHPPQPDAGRMGVQTLRTHRIARAGRARNSLHHHTHAVLSRRCHYGTGVRRSDAGADRHR